MSDIWQQWKNKKLVRDKKGDRILLTEPEKIDIAEAEDMPGLHVKKLEEEAQEFLTEWQNRKTPSMERVSHELADVRQQLHDAWRVFSFDPMWIRMFLGFPPRFPAEGIDRVLEHRVHAFSGSWRDTDPAQWRDHLEGFAEHLEGLFVLTDQISRQLPLTPEAVERKRLEINEKDGAFIKRYVLHLPD